MHDMLFREMQSGKNPELAFESMQKRLQQHVASNVGVESY
jgi:hypothetical protein